MLDKKILTVLTALFLVSSCANGDEAPKLYEMPKRNVNANLQASLSKNFNLNNPAMAGFDDPRAALRTISSGPPPSNYNVSQNPWNYLPPPSYSPENPVSINAQRNMMGGGGMPPPTSAGGIMPPQQNINLGNLSEIGHVSQISNSRTGYNNGYGAPPQMPQMQQMPTMAMPPQMGGNPAMGGGGYGMGGGMMPTQQQGYGNSDPYSSVGLEQPLPNSYDPLRSGFSSNPGQELMPTPTEYPPLGQPQMQMQQMPAMPMPPQMGGSGYGGMPAPQMQMPTMPPPMMGGGGYGGGAQYQSPQSNSGGYGSLTGGGFQPMGEQYATELPGSADDIFGLDDSSIPSVQKGPSPIGGPPPSMSPMPYPAR